MSLLYTNAMYATLFVLLCGSWVASELLGPVRWSGLKTGSQEKRESLAGLILVGLAGLILCFLFPFFLPFASLPWQPGFFFIGVAVVLVGVGWRWYAIKTLGTYFTATVMVQENQPLITHGPYRLIRHPSYTGVLLIVIGLGCMMGNWASVLAITGGLSTIILYRIPREEQVLLHHFGEFYQNYMRHTWRLIPFLF